MHDPDPKTPENPAGDAKEPASRSEEEQMEDYEQSLKETDWGHQPC